MMDWETIARIVVDLITAVLILLTGVMSLAAGVGLLRFPDSLSRLHAGAKPQVLGVIAVCTAIVLQNPSLSTAALALLVVLFQLLTQPIAAHMVARSVYRSTGLRRDLLVLDELADDVRAADRERLERERLAKAKTKAAAAAGAKPRAAGAGPGAAKRRPGSGAAAVD